MATVYFPD